MEDSQSKPSEQTERRPVTERELMNSLDRSLWEVERQRAEDATRSLKR